MVRGGWSPATVAPVSAGRARPGLCRVRRAGPRQGSADRTVLQRTATPWTAPMPQDAPPDALAGEQSGECLTDDNVRELIMQAYRRRAEPPRRNRGGAIADADGRRQTAGGRRSGDAIGLRSRRASCPPGGRVAPRAVARPMRRAGAVIRPDLPARSHLTDVSGLSRSQARGNPIYRSR
jgi:hypothetical protein